MKFHYTVCDVCEYSSDNVHVDNMRCFFRFSILSNDTIASEMDVCSECSTKVWKQSLNIRQVLTAKLSTHSATNGNTDE